MRALALVRAREREERVVESVWREDWRDWIWDLRRVVWVDRVWWTFAWSVSVDRREAAVSFSLSNSAFILSTSRSNLPPSLSHLLTSPSNSPTTPSYCFLTFSISPCTTPLSLRCASSASRACASSRESARWLDWSWETFARSEAMERERAAASA